MSKDKYLKEVFLLIFLYYICSMCVISTNKYLNNSERKCATHLLKHTYNGRLRAVNADFLKTRSWILLQVERNISRKARVPSMHFICIASV